MGDGTDGGDRVAGLIASQREFYDLRAPDFANEAVPDRRVVPLAPRTLRDGRRFDVVKVYWDPTELQDRLSSLGWQGAVRRVGETFLYGSGS